MSKDAEVKEIVPYQVEVKRSFLGISKGTIMTYNNTTNTYIRYDGVFDTGDDFEYDEENYVELSKDIVTKQLGKYFEVKQLTPPPQKEKSKELTKELHNKILDDLKEDDKTEEAVDNGFNELLDMSDLDDEVSMKDKSKGLGETVKTNIKEPEEPIKYEGDLKMKCSVCGHVSTIAHVNEDIAIFMPINKDASASFVCPECNTHLDLFYDNLVPKDESNESTEKS